MIGSAINEDNALLRLTMETKFCPLCMNNFEGESCPYCEPKKEEKDAHPTQS